MFVIFGWGKQTVSNHGPVFRSHCDRCNNEELWQLYTRRTWFTLFFIPVIPYSTEHLLICPVCSSGVVITRAKFEEFKGIADCNMDLMNKKITEDEHKSRIGLLMQEKSSRNNANNSYELSGKTETQINYLRQMDEIRRAKEDGKHLENKSDQNSSNDGGIK